MLQQLLPPASCPNHQQRQPFASSCCSSSAAGSNSSNSSCSRGLNSNTIANWHLRICHAAKSPPPTTLTRPRAQACSTCCCRSSHNHSISTSGRSRSRSHASRVASASTPAAAAAAAVGYVPAESAAAAGSGSTVVAGAESDAVSHPSTVAVGQEVAVRCERLGTGGVGVCLWGPSKLVLLVRGALPGEMLTARITAVKKNYAEGLKLSTLSPHDHAVAPRCQHFGACGGCSLQSLSYEAQLAHKVDHVAQLLSRVAKLDPDVVAAVQKPPVAAHQQYGYRNKIQMAFSNQIWKQQEQEQHQEEVEQVAVSTSLHGSVEPSWGLGFYLPGSNTVVLPIQECHLVSPEVNQVVTQVRLLCQQAGLLPFDPITGTGVLRHLIIRTAEAAAAAEAAGSMSCSIASRRHAPDGSSTSTTVPAADADISNLQPTVKTAAAAGAAANAASGRKLMAVIVTTAGIKQQLQQLKVLEAVADQLMLSCPDLASVVHSIEAPALPAAPTASSDRPNSRSTRTSRSSRSGSSNGRRDKRPGTGTSSSSNSSNSSSRGALALQVESSRVLAGAPGLVESLCGLHFEVSPHSFFQTNTQQAALLYQHVLQAVADCIGHTPSMPREAAAAEQAALSPTSAAPANAKPASTATAADAAAAAAAPIAPTAAGNAASGDVILDLYCGTGTIALCLGSAFPQYQVVGFDVSASSIADAQANAARNGISNTAFICGDLNELLPPASAMQQQKQLHMQGNAQMQRSKVKPAKPQLLQKQQPQQQQLQQLRPRVVVVDPARAGLGPGVVQYLLQCGTERVVYVSCNAATQARDVQLLCGGGDFTVVSWRAVDLFPQTDVDHIETIFVLDRK